MARKRASAAPSAVSEDPFEVLGRKPKGVVYQWVQCAIMGEETHDWLREAKAVGWKPVPRTRHPKMLSIGKEIRFGGMLLMQRPAKLSKLARKREEDAARAMAKRDKKAECLLVYSNMDLSAPAYPEAKAVDEQREKLRRGDGFDYAEFCVTLGVPVSDTELSTSCALGLDITEYARRKFLMASHVMQRISGFDDGKSTPVFEYVTLKTERIYER